MPATRRVKAGRVAAMKMTPEELKNLRAGHKHAVSIQGLHKALETPVVVAPKGSSIKSPLIAIVVLVIVACAVLTALSSRRTNNKARAETVKSQQEEGADVWDAAVQYARANPAQYEQALWRFQAVKAQARGTKYEAMADAEITRIEQAQREVLHRESATVLEDLRVKAQSLVDGQDFAGAAAVYDAYTGPRARETKTERSQLAEVYRERGEQRLREKVNAVEGAKRKEETAKQKVDQTITMVAIDLMGGRKAEALAKADALARDALPSAEQEKARKVADMLLALNRADAEVLKSFEEQANQVVEVPLNDGVQRLLILRVKNGVVQAERRMAQAAVTVNFFPKELPAEEWCRRLKGRVTPETSALYTGLCVFERGRDEEAVKYLSEAGILAPALKTAMDCHLETHKDASARQALGKVLRPFGIYGNSLDWSVVSNRLQEVKWNAAAVAAVQSSLAAFRKDYDETAFAGTQRALLEQMNSFLEGKANPTDTDRHKTTSSRHSRIKTADELKAALLADNPMWIGAVTINDNDGCISRVVVQAPGLEFTNITALAGLPITSLALESCKGISDFSPLAGMPLSYLSLSFCVGFTDRDMAMLAAMPLEHVGLIGTDISDLKPLKGKALKVLFIGGHSTAKVKSLEILHGMPLRRLIVKNAAIVDLTVLDGMPLEELGLEGCYGISDFSVLSRLNSLKTLNLMNTSFCDLSLLKSMNLDFLSFDVVNCKKKSDLQFIRTMKSLRIVKPSTKGQVCSVAKFWAKYDEGEYK